MKLIGFTSGFLGIATGVMLSTSVMAQSSVSFDYGTVVESVPIVKNIRVTTPREECWDEDVVYRDRGGDKELSTVLGAVIGGALGNSVGHHKKNKQVGAVVGAVLGGTIGRSMGKGQHRSTRVGTEEVCRVINEYSEEEQIVGYRVRYRYNDETYTTRTDEDPGDTIKLRLAVTPVI
ncbi:MAG: hypothetical protein ACI9FB_000135 [Candidatus Azotimanducaceae bacterium]|jgi:uncharacterized protein YcfJ